MEVLSFAIDLQSEVETFLQGNLASFLCLSCHTDQKDTGKFYWWPSEPGSEKMLLEQTKKWLNKYPEIFSLNKKIAIAAEKMVLKRKWNH